MHNILKALLTFCLVTAILLVSVSKANEIKLVSNLPSSKLPENNNCDAQICQELLELINNAKHSIDFAVYGLRGQNGILNALLAAKKRGVIIRGIIDKDANGRNYYKDTYLLEKHFDNIKSDQVHDKFIKKILEKKYKDKKLRDNCKRPKNKKGPLQCFEGKAYASKEKIKFKGNLMHNKFFIFDNLNVWTGSANVSDTGIGGYNANFTLVIKSKQIADVYSSEFENMFNGNFSTSKVKIENYRAVHEEQNGNKIILFSPKARAITNKIIPLIEKAKHSIDIAVFFFTHNQLANALVDAQNRGVKVRMILDATGAANAYSKHNHLRENNISVKVENWGGKMHMKSAIIDNKHLIIGSMNWTKAGDIYNDENTLILKNPKLNREFMRTFEVMWNSIPDKWLYQDPKPESPDSIGSCSDGIDNDFDRKIDAMDSGC